MRMHVCPRSELPEILFSEMPENGEKGIISREKTPGKRRHSGEKTGHHFAAFRGGKSRNGCRDDIRKIRSEMRIAGRFYPTCGKVIAEKIKRRIRHCVEC